jgi:hypothetical protein
MKTRIISFPFISTQLPLTSIAISKNHYFFSFSILRPRKERDSGKRKEKKKNKKEIPKNSGYLNFIYILRNEIDGNIKLHCQIRNNFFPLK